MSGLLLCEKKSDVPYRINDSDISIYSIEELAYYLFNNAYFIDDEFFTDNLAEYIEKNLNMKKIAGRLKLAERQRMSYVDKMMIIITGSSYYTEDEAKNFERELKEISTKSVQERMCAKANMLFNNGKYIAAKKIYDSILAMDINPSLKDEFYNNVHINIAKIYCNMFYFDSAVEHLHIVYDNNKSQEILKLVIMAKLMKSKVHDTDVDLSEETAIDDKLVFVCKEEFFDTEDNVCNTEKYHKFRDELQYETGQNPGEYYEKVSKVLDNWKKEYREYVS